MCVRELEMSRGDMRQSEGGDGGVSLRHVSKKDRSASLLNKINQFIKKMASLARRNYV